MNGETLFSTPHAWQDPREVHTSWTCNDAFLDPQVFAPVNPPSHHCNGGYQIPRRSFAMPSYSAQYPHPEFWNIVSHQPHHAQFPGTGQSMPQQMHSHGVIAPPQYYANANTGYPVNPYHNARPTPQMLQYGYRNYQQTPSNLDPRGVPNKAMSNGNSGVGSAACGRCSSTLLSLPPTARVVQTPMSPASPTQARGPPRKPRRSGHAVWVGNIPVGASIEALKDHFSYQATGEIESVFLMAKSNCAFVNYDTQDACVAAVDRFNHSLFGSVRLLCRMRREPATQRGSRKPRAQPATV